MKPYVFVAPFFVIFAAFGLFPLGYTAWVSLHEWHPGGDPSFVGGANYAALAADPDFWNAVGNTVGMFVVATVPQLVLALILAALLNQPLRGMTFLRLGILAPIVTSVAAVAIVFTQLFGRDTGLVNAILGRTIDWQADRWSSWLAIAAMVDWRWTGYNALIYLAAMQLVPKDLYEAARLDGASAARQFRTITVPQIRPTIIFTVVVSTIGGMQLFTEPLLFAQGGSEPLSGGSLHQFQTVAMYMFHKAFRDFDYGYGAAVAWAIFVLVAVASVVNVALARRLRGAE